MDFIQIVPSLFDKKGEDEMKVRGIDFVVYYVTNMQRAIEFYRDTLGVSIGGDPWWMETSLEPVTLAIARSEPQGSQVPQLPPHIALAVEDIQAAIEELRGKGISVDGPDESEYCYMAWFKDPDGNVLMLHQRKDGTWG
jgi:catechol 2,3-dioxygenase-like lactoylglutathione lyase family enzyme